MDAQRASLCDRQSEKLGVGVRRFFPKGLLALGADGGRVAVAEGLGRGRATVVIGPFWLCVLSSRCLPVGNLSWLQWLPHFLLVLAAREGGLRAAGCGCRLCGQ